MDRIRKILASLIVGGSLTQAITLTPQILNTERELNRKPIVQEPDTHDYPRFHHAANVSRETFRSR
jgi:hypothetical protein